LAWNRVGQNTSNIVGIVSLKKDGLLFCNSRNKANILNQQFSFVYIQEDKSYLPKLERSTTSNISSIKVNQNGVAKILRNIKSHKASGPDNIPGRLLKEDADELAPGLIHLFHISTDRGKITSDWTEALVSPIFKKRNRCLTARPWAHHPQLNHQTPGTV
jgi:hypothetical protein